MFTRLVLKTGRRRQFTGAPEEEDAAKKAARERVAFVVFYGKTTRILLQLELVSIFTCTDCLFLVVFCYWSWTSRSLHSGKKNMEKMRTVGKLHTMFLTRFYIIVVHPVVNVCRVSRSTAITSLIVALYILETVKWSSTRSERLYLRLPKCFPAVV